MNIKKLNETISDKTNNLIKENKSLINAFETRLNKRLLIIFSNYNIPFNQDKLSNLMKEYMINNLENINNELSQNYKNMLYKYFDIINEYFHANQNSKNKIKEVTSSFIKAIYKKENPLLNIKLSNSFLNELNNNIYVYDNNELNIKVKQRILDDTSYIIKEWDKNNKIYLNKLIKQIIVFILKGEEDENI